MSTGNKSQSGSTMATVKAGDAVNERSAEAQREAILAAEDRSLRAKARKQDAQMTSGEQRAMAGYIDMLARCYVPAHPEFINEGARGIRVCDRWLVGFRNFLEDMGPPPEVAGDNEDRNGVLGCVE